MSEGLRRLNYHDLYVDISQNPELFIVIEKIHDSLICADILEPSALPLCSRVCALNNAYGPLDAYQFRHPYYKPCVRRLVA